MQLHGLLFKPSIHAIWELLSFKKVCKDGRTRKTLNLMLHKDKLEMLRQEIEDRRYYKNPISKAVYNWSDSAIECYKIGGNCALCSIPQIMETPCQMRDKVKELLEEDKKREMQHGTNSASEGQNDNGNDTKSQKDTVCVGV